MDIISVFIFNNICLCTQERWRERERKIHSDVGPSMSVHIHKHLCVCVCVNIYKIVFCIYLAQKTILGVLTQMPLRFETESLSILKHIT